MRARTPQINLNCGVFVRFLFYFYSFFKFDLNSPHPPKSPLRFWNIFGIFWVIFWIIWGGWVRTPQITTTKAFLGKGGPLGVFAFLGVFGEFWEVGCARTPCFPSTEALLFTIFREAAGFQKPPRKTGPNVTSNPCCLCRPRCTEHGTICGRIIFEDSVD